MLLERKPVIDILRRFGMAFILMAMIVALSFMNPRFFSISNFLTIMRQEVRYGEEPRVHE